MAKKRKHSAALFEKISLKQNGPPPVVRPLFRFTLFRRPAGFGSVALATPSAPPLDPTDPTANMTAASLTARFGGGPPPPAAALPIPVPVLEPAAPTPPAALVVVAQPEPVAAPDLGRVAIPPAPDDSEFSDATPLARSGMRMHFDGDRQEITFRMRYTVAAVAASTLVVALALAYVVGRRSSEEPQTVAQAQPAGASTQVRQGPVQKNVMDLSQRPPRTSLSSSGNTPAKPAVYEDVPLASDSTAHRPTGRNYVVFMSYRDPRIANDARDFLIRNAIPCTVEKDLPRWYNSEKGWYSVVGLRGFPRGYTSLPEYADYVAAATSLGDKFAGKSTSNRFKPMGYKWMD